LNTDKNRELLWRTVPFVMAMLLLALTGIPASAIFGREKAAPAADAGAPIAQLLSIAFGWSRLPANARFTGFCIGMLGDAVFLLSVLCMKDSWRAGIPDKDKTELVTTGIYAFSRNPAFLGFDLMYIGVLLLYGNLLTLGFSLFAMMMLHLQILQEERFLASTFGEPYREYCRRVFRYLGRRKEHKRSY